MKNASNDDGGGGLPLPMLIALIAFFVLLVGVGVAFLLGGPDDGLQTYEGFN